MSTVTHKEKVTAKSSLNDRLLVKFTGTDGKTHNVLWLAKQAVQLGKSEGSFAENLFIVAKDMKQPEFDGFDKDVRAGMKWGKAPTKASKTDKALYGATPRAWKNVCSIINQSFKHSIDIKHYADVYGKDGLNAELKARKDASGSKGSTPTEGKKVMQELYPEIQGAIMHITALDEAIKAQPDHTAMLSLVMEELNDAIERCTEALQAGIQTTGEIDLDKALVAELKKAGTGTAKQASK